MTKQEIQHNFVTAMNDAFARVQREALKNQGSASSLTKSEEIDKVWLTVEEFICEDEAEE